MSALAGRAADVQRLIQARARAQACIADLEDEQAFLAVQLQDACGAHFLEEEESTDALRVISDTETRLADVRRDLARAAVAKSWITQRL